MNFVTWEKLASRREHHVRVVVGGGPGEAHVGRQAISESQNVILELPLQLTYMYLAKELYSVALVNIYLWLVTYVRRWRLRDVKYENMKVKM